MIWHLQAVLATLLVVVSAVSNTQYYRQPSPVYSPRGSSSYGRYGGHSGYGGGGHYGGFNFNPQGFFEQPHGSYSRPKPYKPKPTPKPKPSYDVNYELKRNRKSINYLVKKNQELEHRIKALEGDKSDGGDGSGGDGSGGDGGDNSAIITAIQSDIADIQAKLTANMDRIDEKYFNL